MAQQPVWKTIYCTDHSKLEVDETGVYEPELTVAVPISMDEDYEYNEWYVHRIVLDRCYYTAGILSDNKYHLGSPAWFSRDLMEVCEWSGVKWARAVGDLCCGSPTQRALVYDDIGDYFGYDNFDSDPLVVDKEELLKILS